MIERDTIAAIATPPGSGGIGVVRVSGPAAVPMLARIVRRAEASLCDRMLEVGVARDRDGNRLDEVMFVVMRGPRSFTGEDVAEIHGHGGAANLARLLRAVLAEGARAASAGEFSRRAFESGRLDLCQAEAIFDVIEASTERALRTAQAQLAGGLGQRVAELRRETAALLAEVEASIDFSEGGHDLLPGGAIGERAEALAGELGALCGSFAAGRALREGVEVALVGPVNAGKSSLLNALVGQERAIVDPEPGTTRDVVEARVVWSGLAVTLIDTAGRRTGGSGVERRGIEMGERRAREADLRIVLHPPGASALGLEEELTSDMNAIHVVSKSDLGGVTREVGRRLRTSAATGEGLEELKQMVVERVLGKPGEISESQVVTSERQRGLFGIAEKALKEAAKLSRGGRPPEIVAVEMAAAARALAQVVGEDVNEEMLDALFARFCIGK